MKYSTFNTDAFRVTKVFNQLYTTTILCNVTMEGTNRFVKFANSLEAIYLSFSLFNKDYPADIYNPNENLPNCRCRWLPN